MKRQHLAILFLLVVAAPAALGCNGSSGSSSCSSGGLIGLLLRLLLGGSCQLNQCPDPNSYGRACFVYHDQCSSSNQCSAGQQCCLVAGCGKECVNVGAPPPRIPECPDPNSYGLGCLVYHDQCSSSYQCSAGEQCCLVAGCGKACVNVGAPPPRIPKCPPPRTTICGIADDHNSYCKTSAECPIGQVCCYEGCGRLCKRAIYE